jgi:hypothetical protein
MITDSTGFLMNTVLHPYNTTYLDNAACHIIKFISNDEIANLVNVAYEVNPDSLWGYSYLVKTDLEGNELMTIPMNYSMHLDMVYSNDGAYVIAADLSVKKYDSNGILLFNRQIPFVAKSIIQKDDDFIIAGNIDGNVHVMRIDEDGNQIWHAMYETDSTDIINCVTSTEDGGFALTGKSDNQFYIMKLGADNSSTLNDYCCDPCTFSLNNYPNPFNPSTTIAFSLQNHAEIEVSIFNTKGQKIKQLMSSQMSAGQQSINWNGEDEAGKSVSSGIYYYKLNINGKTEAVKKCLLLK